MRILTPLETKSRKIQVKFSKFFFRSSKSFGKELSKLTLFPESISLKVKFEACKAWRGNFSITSLRSEFVYLANLFFLP